MPKTLLDLINASQRSQIRLTFPDHVIDSLRRGEWPGGEGTIGPEGPTGPTGPAGAPGAGMVWLGDWANDVLYLPGDGVQHGGSSYIAITSNLNGAPPSVNWDLIAERGDAGASGAAGAQGNAGANGAPGNPGADGAAGPNTVTGATTSTLTGILKGTGSLVAVASAPADYVATGDSRLSDTRVPTDLSVTNAKLATMTTKTYKGRTAGTTGAPEDVAVATLKTDLALGNVDNTTDANKPVSSATQTALNLKANLASPTFTGTVSGVTKAMVGLTNATDTSDANKPVSTAQQTALDLKANLTTALDAMGACTDITTRNASTTAHGLMMKYPNNTTDFLRADGTFVAPTAAAAWGSITGTLSTQTDLQTALNLKAPLASPTFTGTVAGVTKAMVGLTSADDTSDAGKPVSTAQQTALNLKANLAAPSFTGNVTISANNIITDTTTGMQIATGATQKLGFFGVTPAVRPTALTQTYSTASATHAAVTQLAAPAGGTGVAAGGWSTAANRDLAITSINAARTDIANLKQFVNQIVDQLQALGLLQ